MIGQTLGHYRVVEKIGAGGMGLVYRARDAHLERDVALKVLPAGTLADEAARKRFRKEALALPKLNHPNIGSVHDFDTQDGVDFLVMEYIPGGTLAERLVGGALQEKEVAALGGQIAGALEEAHEYGVVHRDLKPGNIVVTPKGQVKVLDFGLAKLLPSVSEAVATESLTETQVAAGTLPYMAPEQLRGEKVDARTDIYALGTVLYEMATGQRPFREALAPRLIDGILHQAPQPPSGLNRRVSPQLESIILKALDKEPERRYQSASELRVDLERLSAPVPSIAAARPRALGRRWLLAAGAAVGVLLAVLTALNVGGWRERLLGRAGSPRIESLAVLPLENLSRDPEQEYFADGMTEALITDLAKISALRVISRTSVMRYKGSEKPLPQIVKELGVDAVVEGSVARSGERVRITAQLIDAATDRHLWAESYERDLRDVLALQGEVARTIASEIRIKVTPQEQVRLASARSVNPEAHEAYLKARYFFSKRTVEGLRKSIGYYQQAIEKDPNYALAYAGLPDSYLLFAAYAHLPTTETVPKAKAAVLKALEMDDTLAEAHTVLAMLREDEWDWSGAGKEYRRAIELNPNYPRAHQLYSGHLELMGKHHEGIAEIKRAQELDPFSLIINMNVGAVLYWARQYDRAIEQCRKTLEMDPNFAPTHGCLAGVYEQKASYKDAIAEYKKAVDLSGGDPSNVAGLGHAYGVAGKKSEARNILNELMALSKRRYVSPYAIALVHLGLGEKDQAFKWLEKAYEVRRSELPDIKVDHRFDPLRSDPRFQDLLRRIGLPQ